MGLAKIYRVYMIQEKELVRGGSWSMCAVSAVLVSLGYGSYHYNLPHDATSSQSNHY